MHLVKVVAILVVTFIASAVYAGQAVKLREPTAEVVKFENPSIIKADCDTKECGCGLTDHGIGKDYILEYNVPDLSKYDKSGFKIWSNNADVRSGITKKDDWDGLDYGKDVSNKIRLCLGASRYDHHPLGSPLRQDFVELYLWYSITNEDPPDDPNTGKLPIAEVHEPTAQIDTTPSDDRDNGYVDPYAGYDHDVGLKYLKIGKRSSGNWDGSVTYQEGQVPNKKDFRVKLKRKAGKWKDCCAKIYFSHNEYFSRDKDTYLGKESKRLSRDKYDEYNEKSIYVEDIYLPQDMEGGKNYYFFTVVEYSGGKNSSTRTDKDEYVKVDILPKPRYNVETVNLSINILNPLPGRAFSASATVRNEFDSASASAQLKIYGTSINNGGIILGNQSLGAMGKGESRNVTFYQNLPNYSGDFRIFICSNLNQTEVNHTDNCVAADFTVMEPDSDSDGIPDRDEPGDSDGDGINDAHESYLSDSDNDGVSDQLDELNDDPNNDSDNDGYSNLEEVEAGTDPLDSMSTPAEYNFEITDLSIEVKDRIKLWPEEAYSVSVTAYNSGDDFQENISLGYYLDDVLIGSHSLSASDLTSGAYVSDFLNDITASSEPGDYTVRVCVDYDDQIQETDESDNCQSIDIRVEKHLSPAVLQLFFGG